MLTKDEEESKFTTLVRQGTDAHEALVHKMCMVIAGWVLKNQQPLLVNDISADERFQGLQILGYPLKAILAVPIQAAGNTLGVLILHGDQEDKAFSERDLRTLNIVASQSAHVLRNAEKLRRLKDENRFLKTQVERSYSFEGIIGHGSEMERVFNLLEKIIPTDIRVLIQGESGTGKELVAKAIHYNSPRKKSRFIAIDCGALPENLLQSELFGHVKGAFTGATESKRGLFQAADGGSLFLDEINNTSPALQAKLLRAIQEKEIRPLGGTKTLKVDVRVICASSQDLAQAVEEGTFRQDLFFRLNVVTVQLPPLRKRTEDIPILADYFLKEFSSRMEKKLARFSESSLRRLLDHSWPGNVRELENVVERCVTLAEPATEVVDPDLLPEEVGASHTASGGGSSQTHDLANAVERLEREMVADALSKSDGNRTKAAQSLGLSRRGLLNKIERYGLEH
jgi:transcriptional regulator with GAF, ATPase, and Fis domain